MNLNFRIKIYIAVAIFLAITYIFKNINEDESLHVIGGIPDFEFIDSEGRDVGLSSLKGKVWVADFIFTTCTMACPIMTGNMNIIHKKYKKNDDLRLVPLTLGLLSLPLQQSTLYKIHNLGLNNFPLSK